MIRRNIRVHPSADVLGSELMEALGSLVSVRFESCPNLVECKHGDAVISLSGDDQVLTNLPHTGLCCFHFSQGVGASDRESGDDHIRFGNSQLLDQRLRGRILAHRALPGLNFVRPERGDDVLANVRGHPVWIKREYPGLSADIVSAPLPKPMEAEKPFDYLNGEQFIQLLPLVHFLRQVAPGSGWKGQPLRACFIFDDPNLHWTSYGFLHYRELVLRAKTLGYHVALATVPFDTWTTHRATAVLFRENSKHLSLLIHGNDHLRAELGQVRSPEQHLRLLAQSLRRIVRLEEAAGLHVARVMAAPHGACAEAALATMLVVGFEGACISTGSLRGWNRHRQWQPTFGLEIAEIMDGGLPVLPRFRMSTSCEGLIVISAFLDRPIIPFGHHDTVADGLDLLSHLTDVINSLGAVRWENPELMLRSNYLSLQEGATLRLRPFSCRIQLTVPDDVTTMVLDTPRKASDPYSGGYDLITSRAAESQPARIAPGEPVSVRPGMAVELTAPGLGTVDFRKVKPMPPSPWALTRRILCEGRDRLRPLISRRRGFAVMPIYGPPNAAD